LAKEPKTSARKLEWTAFFLALLGYVPIAFFTILVIVRPGLVPVENDRLSDMAGSVTALKAYAAIILSFLGGIRWGAAVSGAPSEAQVLVISVLPSLVGWFAFFLGEPWSFAVFAAAFAAMGWWDRNATKAGNLPVWFGRLRLLLSILVTGTMLTAFAASI
jgi:hypothetical protein